MKERFLKLIDFVWRQREVWSYGGAVVVDQKTEGKYEVTVEELMAELELVEVDMKVVVMKEVVGGH